MESRLRLLRCCCCYLSIAFLQPRTLLVGADGQLMPTQLQQSQLPPPPTSPPPITVTLTSLLTQSEKTSEEPPQTTQPPTTTAVRQSLAGTVQETTSPTSNSASQLPSQNAATNSESYPTTQSSHGTSMSSGVSLPDTLTNATLLAEVVSSSTVHPSTTAVYSSSSSSSSSPSFSSTSSTLPSSSSLPSSSAPISSSTDISSILPRQSLAPSANTSQVVTRVPGQPSPTTGIAMQRTAADTSTADLAGPSNDSSLQWTTFSAPVMPLAPSGLSYLGCWSGSSFWMADNASFVHPANSTVINQTLVAEHCASSAATNDQAQFIAIDVNLNCFIGLNDSVFTAAPTDSIASTSPSSRKSCLKVYDIYRGYQPIGCWKFALGTGIDNITGYAKAIPDDHSEAVVMLQDACGLVARLHGYAAFITQSSGSCFGARDPQSWLSGLIRYLDPCPDSQQTMSVYILGEVPVNDYTQWSSWTSCSRGCGVGNTTRVRYRIKDNDPLLQMEDAVCNERPCPWRTDIPQWAGCWTSVPGMLLSMESLLLSPADKNPSMRQAAVEKCAVLSYGKYLAFAIQDGHCLAIANDRLLMLYTNNASSDACPTLNPYASGGYDVYSFSAEPPPGSWGVWSPFDSCTVACGKGGSRTRKRACNNPPSAMGCPPGQPQEEDVESCNNRECPLNFKWAVSMGCYNVPASYVELSNPLLDGLPRTQRKDPFHKCAVVAFTKNYAVFGLTADNLCWTGPQFYCQLNQTGAGMTSCPSKPGLPQTMEVYWFQQVTSASSTAAASTRSAFAPGGTAAVICPTTSSSPLSAPPTSSVPSATVEGPTVAAVASTPCPTASTTGSVASTSQVALDQFGLPMTVHYNDAAAALNSASVLAKQLSASNETGKTLADFLSNLNSKLVLGNASEASSFLDSFGATLSAFTASDMAPLWNKAPQYGGLMLQSAEEVALYCGSLVDNKTITEPNVVMQIITVSSNPSDPALLIFDSLSSTGTTSLTIPPAVFTTTAGSRLTVAAIQLESFASALNSPEASNSSRVLNGTMLPAVLSIRTNVIAPNTVLPEQVIVRMAYNSSGIGSNMNGTCVFWNVTSEQWSTDGCLTVAVNSAVECHCNHLTSFAILMRVDDYEPVGDTATALTYISYVGCGISVACLITTFGVLLYLTNLKTDKKTIHMNLVVSLGIAQVTHISGINLTSDSITCTVIAAMLHFFYTTAFFWMLCEGLHLYLKVVAVFNSENASKRIIYYLIGYVCPAVIVAISVGIRHDGYGNKNFCWLSTNDGLVWAFIGPVCAIILCNIVILCIVMKIVISTAATIPNKKKKDFQLVRTGVKGVMILMPLLGVSWLLGLLAVNSSTLVFEFLFVIINSTQGLFIFLFHCVGSSEVRSAFRRKRDQSSRSKDGKRSSVVQSTNDPSPNNNNRTTKDGIAILVEDPRFPVLYLNNFQADGQKVPLTIESAIDGLLNGTLGLNVGGYKHAVPEDVDVVDINSYSKSAIDVTENYEDEIENDDIDEDIISAELAEASQDDVIGGCLKTVDRSTTLGSREQTRLDMSNCERRSALSTGQLREASALTRLGTARRVTSAGPERPGTKDISGSTTTSAALQAARTNSIQTSSGIGSSLSLDSSWEDEIIQSMLAERPQTAIMTRPVSQEPRSRVSSAKARLADLPKTNRSNSEDNNREEAACAAQGTRSSSAKHSGSVHARSPTVSVSSTSLRNRSGKRSAKVSPSPMPVDDDDGRASTAMADDGKTTPALQHPFRLTSVSASTNFVYTK